MENIVGVFFAGQMPFLLAILRYSQKEVEFVRTAVFIYSEIITEQEFIYC